MPRGRPLMKARDQAPDERQLIEAAQRDPRRFGELYELNFERVYAYVVSRIRDRSDAQDVTAEVFHQALRHLAKFEWRGVPFAAWLYRMAANAIADRAQRLSREQTIEAPEQIDERDFEDAEHTAQIFRLVKELPDDQRRVLEMRFVEEKSIGDIAREIGRSEGAVKQLQFRGLQNLRDRIGEKHG
jgi:RNA polymerase sigma-70 factor (ECF subfamily)